MDINQTSLPFHKLSMKEDVVKVLEIQWVIFIERDVQGVNLAIALPKKKLEIDVKENRSLLSAEIQTQ